MKQTMQGKTAITLINNCIIIFSLFSVLHIASEAGYGQIQINQEFLLRLIDAWPNQPADVNQDGTTDYRDIFLIADRWYALYEPQPLSSPTPTSTLIPTTTPTNTPFIGEPAILIVDTSPFNLETGVSVTRETIIYLNGAIDPLTVNPQSIQAVFADQQLEYRIHVSPDNKRIILFYQNPLPSMARIRVSIDGDQVISSDGIPIDADRDGVPGGIGMIEFETASFDTTVDQAVTGRVFSTELLALPGSVESINLPLEGVTISVKGRENELVAVTDATGNFRLQPVPAGRFFVQIDGRTVDFIIVNKIPIATRYPEGPYLPLLETDWEVQPGASETNIGSIYLPMVAAQTLQPVQPNQETTVSLPPGVLAKYPHLSGSSITVPANSMFLNDGTRGGSVGLAPLPPTRLPAPLTLLPWFIPSAVITVQTDGATNFDLPARICLPNLPNPLTGYLAPVGSERSLFAYQHDTGEFEYIAPMRVNANGNLACTDREVGIFSPGWLFAGPPANEPPEPPSCYLAVETEPAAISRSSAEDIGPYQIGDPARLLVGHQLLCVVSYLSLKLPNYIQSGIGNPPPVAPWLESLIHQVSHVDKYLAEISRQFHNLCIRISPGGASSTTRSHLISTRQSYDLSTVFDDEIARDLIGMYYEIAELLMPYYRTRDVVISESVFQETADRLQTAETAAPGTVFAYLLNLRVRYEQQLVSSAIAEAGEIRGNAPPYPIRFAAQITRGNGETLVVRGMTKPYGVYRIFTPEDGVIDRVVFYDETTNRMATVYPNRRQNAAFELPGLYLFSADIFDLFDFDGDGVANDIEQIYGADPYQ